MNAQKASKFSQRTGFIVGLPSILPFKCLFEVDTVGENQLIATDFQLVLADFEPEITFVCFGCFSIRKNSRNRCFSLS